MTRKRRSGGSGDGKDRDANGRDAEGRGLRWLERAEPWILVAIVALIALLWLLARLLGAPWAGG